MNARRIHPPAPRPVKKAPELVLVTPDFASQLLLNNPGNRPISPSRVESLVRAIKTGDWRVSNTTIALDEDTLAVQDGQHRLSAIAQSNIACWALMSWHSERDREVFNRGKPDGIGGALTRLFGEANGNTKASIIARMERLANRDHGARPGSLAEFRAILSRRRDAVEWVIKTAADNRRARAANISGPAAFTWFANKAKAQEFFTQVVAGEGLKRHMPAHAFRKVMLEENPVGRDTSGMDLSLRYLTAAHAYFRGADLRQSPKVSEIALQFFRKHYEATR